MQGQVACPACLKRNRDTKLVAKQINFDIAVYLCPLKKCRYPKGYPWLVIKRTLEEFTELVLRDKQEHMSGTTKANVAGDINNMLQKPTSDVDALNSILNDLNNVTVDNVQITESLTLPQQSEITNNLNMVDFTNANSDIFNVGCPVNTGPNEASDCNFFTTSIDDILTEFSSSSEVLCSDDFNVDSLLDDILLC